VYLTLKQVASVETIISALSELEEDLDNISVKTDEMKRRLVNLSYEQIEHLKEKIINLANGEARKIIDTAREEAENEASTILKGSENELVNIKKNIESSYDKAVEVAVKIILWGKP
jgi:V/A-type H+/Na+-transporting ATPase subunit G/H